MLVTKKSGPHSLKEVINKMKNSCSKYEGKIQDIEPSEEL